MSIVIGIDLGTTNSCVAVPETADIPNRQALLDSGRLRPVGGTLVVMDPYGSPTTPSVVWLDADGTPLVGIMAKQKAKIPAEPPPAMFFKRSMGTDERMTAGHAQLTPQQASTYVLRYLKGMAEEALNVSVDRAIVTVPAFFEMRAKNETTQAGRDAGLDVAETLLEPVAAALTYTRTRELSGSQTFLVYDLGGGTFDASVVSWDPETGFENRSFNGDRYLGGYEFDKAIVRWIAEQLPRYDLRLQPDEKLLARLLVHAEAAKQELTLEPVTTIVDATAEDRAGVPMSINLPLRRDVFERLIEQQIRGTLDRCDLALEKEGVKPEDMADIVMVGGSSRIPLVARLLRERYRRDPLIIDPNLCVAVGAAIKAATLATSSTYLLLDQPTPVTSLPAIDVSGRVRAGEQILFASGVTVQLTSADGVQRREERTNAEGRFLFQDVALHEESENEFTVRVLAPEAHGPELDMQRLLVRHEQDPRGADITAEGDVLAHDIAVELATGYHMVAQAGQKLPYRTQVWLETATTGDLLRIRLLEGPTPIGGVEVRDLPNDLPIGSEVQVDLEFQRGWTIRAEARVPAAGPDAIGMTVIEIPQIELPSWDGLRRDYQAVCLSWQEKRPVASPADLIRIGPQVDSLLQEVEFLINEGLDRAKAHHKLQQAETNLDRIALPKGLQPPWEGFAASLDELDQLTTQLAARDEKKAQQFREGIPGLRAAGRAAYDARKPLDWNSTNEAVQSRIAAVNNLLKAVNGPPPPPPVPLLKLMVADELTSIVRAVQEMDRITGEKFHPEAQAFQDEAQTIKASVLSIDVADQAGANRLIGIYNAQIQPLRARVERWMEKCRTPSGKEIKVQLPRRSLP